MIQNNKAHDIIDILEIKQTATVDYLAKRLYMSPSTIRRYLDTLEKQGHIRRFHGGASIANYPTSLLPIDRRMHSNEDKKKIIGFTASKLIENGDTIYIDSSSTASTIIPHLSKYRNLRIVTNSIFSMIQLQKTNFDVYCIGGNLLRHSSAMGGHYATEMLSNFYIDKMFFSTASLAQNGMLLDTSEAENELRNCAMRNSKQKFCMMDSSKLNIAAPLRFCHLRDIDVIITDADLENLIPWQDDYPIVHQAISSKVEK